jgi:hypothetical protein
LLMAELSVEVVATGPDVCHLFLWPRCDVYQHLLIASLVV